MLNENYFNGDLGEIQSYYLGLLLGSGKFSKNTNKITLDMKDYEIIYAFKIELGISGRVKAKAPCTLKNREVIGGKFPTYSVEFTSERITKDLKDLGVGYKNRKLLLYNDRIQTNHYLRGYLDADGYITVKNLHTGHAPQLRIGYTIEDRNILEILRKYITERLELKCRVEQQSNKRGWKLILTCLDALSFCNWIYNDATVYLRRKKVIYDVAIKQREELITIIE